MPASGRLCLICWYLYLFCWIQVVLLEVYPVKAAMLLNPSGTVANLSDSYLQISQAEISQAEISQEFEELSEQVTIVEVSPLPHQERDKITVNQQQTYQAFTICQPLSEGDGCQEKIFIEEMSTGKYYQVQGIPLSWRPFNNLVWQEEAVLVFDRWSNPHYGLRYTVDMDRKKLVDVSAFEED